MAKNKHGKEIKEYPKLVKAASGGKVLCQNKAEEDAVPKPEGETKPAGWGKKSKDTA